MSFDKVLIANRGEIAVRLIRACRSLDLTTVAVYSQADADALHVRLADEAVCIGPPEARHSYLNADKLIEAARACGAGAVHPGYGFLAENADFARACKAAGLVFVGPHPEAIAVMGAKREAKRLAIDAGVPCVPGYHGEDQDDGRLREEAARIGTPLLIKASAGGGGRGMRRIDDLGQFDEAVKLAREEARAAFGDPTLLLEKFISAPRHIEVQILGDKHGQVRHLFERDCSVQRNYQKIIEEAPAPNLSEVTRSQMLDAAVQLAQAIGYDNAGTVEFVVDAHSGEAYFLEMNTRLQVEHPVTEAITGIDLAAWQLRIVAGEAIDFAQNDVQCQGWAMEARIAAEDPAAGYQPQTGRIDRYREPALGGVRMDSGVASGSVVSPYYDSMLAKLIVQARNRAAAIRKLSRALDELQIGGLKLNAPFLREVLELPAFTAGEHLTGVLDEAWPRGWQPAGITDADRACAVLARHLSARPQGAGPWASLGAWRIGEAHGRVGQSRWYLSEGDAALQAVMVSGKGGDLQVQFAGGNEIAVRQACLEDGELRFVDEQGRQRIALTVGGDAVELLAHPAQVRFTICLAERALLGDAGAGAGGGQQISAPTPGQIVEVLVSDGDQVRAGQPVVVLEAMKMLQQLCASSDGIVAGVSVAAGDAVNSGDTLVTLELQET